MVIPRLLQPIVKGRKEGRKEEERERDKGARGQEEELKNRSKQRKPVSDESQFD